MSDANAASKSVINTERQHTLHGADLSWLHLMLLGSLTDRTAPATDPSPGAPEVRAPAFHIPSHVLDVGNTVDLLDPEGVTLAQLTVESTAPERVGGFVQQRSGFSLVDHIDLRLDPTELSSELSQPAWAMWSDGTLTLAARTAIREAAANVGATIVELVPLPTGSETSRVANAPVRLALAETTRREADRLVVVPWPSIDEPTAALRLQAAIGASFGADALVTVDPDLADNDLAVPLRLVDVPQDRRTLPLDLVDDWVLHGTQLPEWAAESDVATTLTQVHRPSSRAGLTVLLSGLSGSGKSTVARSLAVRLVEREARSVSLLDGDVVRHHLSKGLGFSRPDRITNVLRIGFVASEITKAGGIAVCCPIAPYDQTRREVRAMVEEHGRFVLVHVATPLGECERRDRKGLYAKARRGEIPEFTGISDPYETPTDAEVVIDTTGRTIDDCVDAVYSYLVSQGLIEG